MNDTIGTATTDDFGHNHIFVGAASARNERRTWIVVALTAAMTLIEIIGGTLFHSIALVADGIHMSTHAGVMLLAAIAYRAARHYAEDERFALGTGKLGDLAAFTSAIVLALFSALIAFEAISRLFAPETINYAAAIPIAVLGLTVNAVSALVLAGHHDHSHGHSHGHSHAHHHDDAEETHEIATGLGTVTLGIAEVSSPPRFHLTGLPDDAAITVETVREGGIHQTFALIRQGDDFFSREEIPEPHEFRAILNLQRGAQSESHSVRFEEHAHDATLHRDNNMRAAYVHVLADSAVSILVILGLLGAKFGGWVWLDPVMGLLGAAVVGNWAYGLIRAAGAILLDMTPSRTIQGRVRAAIENDDTEITDLHIWRLGPGHLGAIIALRTSTPEPSRHYRRKLSAIKELSHITIEVDAK